MVRHPAHDPLAATRLRHNHQNRAWHARRAVHARGPEAAVHRRDGGLPRPPHRRHGGGPPPHGIEASVPEGGGPVAGRRAPPGPAIQGSAHVPRRTRHALAHGRGDADLHRIRPHSLRGGRAGHVLGHLLAAGRRNVPHVPGRDHHAGRQHLHAAADEHGHGAVRAGRPSRIGIDPGGDRHGRAAGDGERIGGARDVRQRLLLARAGANALRVSSGTAVARWTERYVG